MKNFTRNIRTNFTHSMKSQTSTLRKSPEVQLSPLYHLSLLQERSEKALTRVAHRSALLSRSSHVASTLISRIPRCFTNLFFAGSSRSTRLTHLASSVVAKGGRGGPTIAGTRAKPSGGARWGDREAKSYKGFPKYCVNRLGRGGEEGTRQLKIWGEIR